MKIRLGLISWATGTLMLAVVSACGGSDTDPPATADPSSTRLTQESSRAPSQSSSSSPTNDSVEAAAATEAVVRQYFAVVDRLRQQPESPLRALNAVATSGELSAQQRLIQSERRRGLKQVGDTLVSEAQVQSVSLGSSDPKAGQVPTAQVDVCWNVSNVDVVDKTGKSVVSPSRPDSGWIRFTVANYHWPTNPDDGWRVASSQDLKHTPCAPS